MAVHRGGYAEDDLPIVPKGSTKVLPPRAARGAQLDGTAPTFSARDTQNSLPAAVPADVPVTYAQQRASGPAASFGGNNLPTIQLGSPATAFQIVIGGAALWMLASKLAK
jgi:hypothetical protein